MGLGTFVGRLGPLAAALGVGAVVSLSSPPVAVASPDGTDTSSASADEPGSANRGRSAGRSKAADRTETPRAATPRPAAATAVRTGRALPAVAAPQKQQRSAGDSAQQPVSSVVVRPAPAEELPATGAVPRFVPAPQPVSVSAPVAAAPAPDLAAVTRAVAPVATAAPALRRSAAGTLAALPTTGGLGGDRLPEPAAASIADLLAVAFVRRETAPAARARAGFGFASLFRNSAPALNPSQGAQSAGGVIAGRLNASDPDGDSLSYDVTQGPARGNVALGADGSYTYTTDPALAATGTTDSFEVSVSDADSGLHFHGFAGLLNGLTSGRLGSGGHSRTATVSVVVTPFGPANRAPTATAMVDPPNALTGVVTGRVAGADADGDPLTYTAPTTTAKGGIGLNASSGTFTYTPTDTARRAAAAPGATGADRTDGFTVTVADGRGGVATVAVTVAISPSTNHAPTGTAVIGAPNPVTGVVTGSVLGADTDSDPLSYSGSTTTANGAVTVTAAGAFTYTPTAAARHNSAVPGAPAGDRTDSFTVTINDGRGGTATVPVAVAVSPANIAPVLGVTSVGTPDPGTGVVTGRVTATDADGDPLIYAAPSTTSRGAVAVNAATGSFTYTPSTLARQTAGAPGASDADRQDNFIVSITDGHGGVVTAAVTVPVSPSSEPAAPLAAFPGAEGFGASATGGRGGSVIYVTNLNAAGPGSLQWAIDQPGARYILFKVSGVIDTQIHLTNGDVTIAGQTSPGGITIRGLVTDESPYQDQAVRAPSDFAENWILQHIRIRPGLDGASDDGLRMRYTRNAIVDHVSIGNATDEAIEISYSHDITVQNTLIAETLGGHSFYGGILMNYSNPAYGFGLDNVSLHHNVFNRIEGRLPEGSRESGAAANTYMNLELSNNLYWDPRFFIALGVDTAVAGGQPIYWRLNAVNNFFRTANNFQFGMFDDQLLNVARNELFVSGNKMSQYPSRSDYQLFYCCNDYPAESSPDATSRRAQARTSRHPFPAITYTPTDQLRTVLLNTAGAWPRDPMDIRLMGNVASNTIASAAPNVNPANDALLPAYTGSAPAAPVDTDSDGMPDTWETAKGLNPNVANTNAHTLSAVGYTDLDIYLSELSVSRVTGWAG